VQRLRAVAERLRANFFVLPAAAVVLAFFGARLAVGVDVGDWVGDATVDSARSLMSTVAAATITFASISFSVSLLIMQQGSTQFSPRVIHGLTRDPFNRRVIAMVLATFTYCLVVLQRTRAAIDDGGEAVVPRFAVALGLVLGVLAVLAVVAAIHHTARMMDVSEILGDIVERTLEVDEPVPTPGLRACPVAAAPDGEHPCTVVRFDDDGWIGQIDRSALLRATPRGSLVRLETDTGRYAIRSTKLCTIWPPLAAEDEREVSSRVRGSVRLGRTRTMVEDGAYGIRQLVDVALRALSPGINDPTTAQDAIFHLGTVLSARLDDPPAPLAYEDDDDRCLLTPHAATDDALAELAFTELRAAAAGDARVSLYLLEMIAAVAEVAASKGARDRAAPFEAQALLLARGATAATRSDVLAAYRARFTG